MRSSWLEQLCGKAISHQFAAKPQLGSPILLSTPPPLSLSLFPALITALSPSLYILLLGDRVFRH